jgi:hypothetical protein
MSRIADIDGGEVRHYSSATARTRRVNDIVNETQAPIPGERSDKLRRRDTVFAIAQPESSQLPIAGIEIENTFCLVDDGRGILRIRAKPSGRLRRRQRIRESSLPDNRSGASVEGKHGIVAADYEDQRLSALRGVPSITSGAVSVDKAISVGLVLSWVLHFSSRRETLSLERVVSPLFQPVRC